MRNYLAFAAIAALSVAAPATAQSVFDGTWKVDTSTAKMPSKPYTFALKGGTFTCSSCVPAYSVPADGQFHAVSGQPYFDALSVTVTDPKTIALAYKHQGKQVETLTETLSDDGNSMRYADVDMSAPNGKTVTSNGTMTRASATDDGAHAISGGWIADKGADVSDAALMVTIKTAGDELTLTQPTGYHYTAKIGGPAVPIEGDQAKTMAAVAMAGPRTMTETDTRGGKVVTVMTITASEDGKTLDVVSDNKVQGTTSQIQAIKQ